MTRSSDSYYTDDEGEIAVLIARDMIDSHIAGTASKTFSTTPKFDEKRGVFVTLNTHPGEELRGCIGYPQPIFPLLKALVKAAVESTQDPRFPRLAKKELDHVTVEVSLLTLPQEIKVKKTRDYVNEVTIGTDGLIVAQGPYRGLLLPQVPVEWHWDVEEFLAQTCMKAGLTPDSWLDRGTRLYKFQSEIFGEEGPHGPIKRRMLGVSHVSP